MNLLSKADMLNKNKPGAYLIKQSAMRMKALNISIVELKNKAGVKTNAIWNILRRKSKSSNAVTHRKSETRTKIQSEGLLMKSGLTEAFSIFPTVDLQLNADEREETTPLLGTFIHMYQNIISTPHNASQKEEMAIFGRSAFASHFLSTKQETKGRI